MRKLSAIAAAASAMLLGGCLRNDISYPDIKPAITDIRFENQIGDPVIDAEARTITVEIHETADMSKVRMLSVKSNYDSQVTFISGVTVDGDEIIMDFTGKVVLGVSVYDTFEWTVTAFQEIKRYVRIRNQVGAEDINEQEKMVVVRVAETNPLDEVDIIDMKLGIEGSVITPDFREVHDFVEVRYFESVFEGVSDKWGVRVIPSKVEQSVASVNAWAYSADVEGMLSGKDAEVWLEYRKTSDTEWTRHDAVTVDGINIKASIGGLQDGTPYEVRIASESGASSEFAFTTEKAAQIPNISFDDWFQDAKKAWFPRASETDEVWWDTANMGANTLSPVNPTTPESSFVAVSGEGKHAARLETKSVVGVMAAGNLYSGRYKGTQGITALLDFGVPFESRPIGLRGYYSYSPKTIDKVKPPYTSLKGMRDMCQIYIMLTAWETPFPVNSSEQHYIDMNDPDILAFRELVTDEDTDGKYVEFFIHLDDEAWRDKTRKATHILVISCASRYGDYFTGAVGSVLYVDEFQLVYDKSEIPTDGSVLIVDKDYHNSNEDLGL